MSDNHPLDGVRLAGAVQLEELAAVASRLAARLRSAEALPRVAVGRLTVDANGMLNRLGRHELRLQEEAAQEHAEPAALAIDCHARSVTH
jgi:hypothetical protein